MQTEHPTPSTSPSRWIKTCLFGGLCLLLMAPGTAQLFRMSRESPSWWIEDLARAHVAPLVSQITGRGSREVIAGRSGWLFHRESLEYLAGNDANPSGRPGEASLRAISHFHEQLASRGVELVLVSTPVKATVHPEFLHRRLNLESEVQWQDYEGFLQELAEKGVRVLDLTPTLRALARTQETYLRNDTHWTPQGARVAANLVAEEIRALEVLDTKAAMTFDSRKVLLETQGDLAALLPNHNLRERQTVELEQVVMTRDGRTPLGDRKAEVLLLGDSFSLAYGAPRLGLGRDASFAHHLARALGQTLDVIAVPGGGATQARRSLSARPEGLLGKKLVVWQVAQRDLLRARDGWSSVTLPANSDGNEKSPSDTEQRDTEEATSLRVETIEHDLPMDLDYGDCVALLPYRVLDGDGSEIQAGETVRLAHWGWLDYEAQPFLHEPAGRQFDVVVLPLEQGVSLESTCWMGELGGNPLWVVDRRRKR